MSVQAITCALAIRGIEHDLEIIIAKNRSGPICNVKAWVDVACNVVLEAG